MLPTVSEYLSLEVHGSSRPEFLGHHGFLTEGSQCEMGS